MVNAGLRMHIPSIVGAQTGTATPATSGFSLIAEDGNALPGVAPRYRPKYSWRQAKSMTWDGQCPSSKRERRHPRCSPYL